MTGYGRGDCSKDGFKVTVEVSSVNRKQTEISVNLPRQMELLEAQVRDVINRYVARGRLIVRVSLHAGVGKGAARMHLNVPLAKAYARELSRLSKQLKLPGPCDEALGLDNDGAQRLRKFGGSGGGMPVRPTAQDFQFRP